MSVGNALYKFESNSGSLNQTRMRIGLSPLHQQLFTYNIVADPLCPFCSQENESAEYYFLRCPTFIAQRDIMIQQLRQLLPAELFCHQKTQSLVKIILQGYEDLSLTENKSVFEICQTFILNSKRFDRRILHD